MKKFLYSLLFLLPLGFAAASCDDDDDKVPNVNIQAQMEGGVLDDGTIYVVEGENLQITSLTLVNNTNKEGVIGAVTYYWNFSPIAVASVSPYECTIPTAGMQPGRYLLQARMPIYVVDYPICWGLLEYFVEIVESPDDLPGTPGTATLPGTISDKDKN